MVGEYGPRSDKTLNKSERIAAFSSQIRLKPQTELSAPKIDSVMYQYLDMSRAQTEKWPPKPTEAQSSKTNIRIYSNSYTEYLNTIFSIRSHPYRWAYFTPSIFFSSKLLISINKTDHSV